MKQITLLICGFVMAISAYSQAFSVKGKISGANIPVTFVLAYAGQELKQMSNDGTFSFSGTQFPANATLKLIPYNPHLTLEDTSYWSWVKPYSHLLGARTFFLEGNITINGKSMNDATVNGMNQKLYETFRLKEEALTKSLDSIRSLGKATDEPEEDENDGPEQTGSVPSEATQKLFAKLSALRLGFVKKYPDSYFSLNLADETSSSGDVATFNKMLDALSERMRKTERFASLKVMAKGFNMNKLGNVAKAFELNTATGTPVSLTSYKGKYVLIDFWASWCAPCRAENPNVVKAYNEFKDKNFDILSISLDAKREEWLKAVKEDQLPWTQVIDKKGAGSVALAYAVTGIPDNVLLDPNGVIIGKGLRGAALQAALSKVLK